MKSRKVNQLLQSTSLWNTFVMVGAVQAFLEMACTSLPNLLAQVKDFPPWRGRETKLLVELYRSLPATDFSRDALTAEPERLRVMALEGIGWSDLGSVERVESTIQR